MLEEYRAHVKERAEMGVVPQPLSAAQTASLVDLLKDPPAGEEEFLMNLLTERVPAGVDEAAYVKAGFLAAIASGERDFDAISSRLKLAAINYVSGTQTKRTLMAFAASDNMGS